MISGDGERAHHEFLEENRELEKHGLSSELSRRQFMRAAGVLTAGLAVGLDGAALAETADGPTTKAVTLKVNGKSQALTVDSRTSLLDALRENLDLTGI